MLHFVWQGHDVSKFGLCGQMDLAVFKLQDPMLPNIIAKRIQFFFAGRKSQNCNKSLDANFLRNRYEGLPESSFKLVNDGIESLLESHNLFFSWKIISKLTAC